jgi:hypothetical protein
VCRIKGEHPDWTERQIASAAKCSPSYVHKVLTEQVSSEHFSEHFSEQPEVSSEHVMDSLTAKITELEARLVEDRECIDAHTMLISKLFKKIDAQSKLISELYEWKDAFVADFGQVCQKIAPVTVETFTETVELAWPGAETATEPETDYHASDADDLTERIKAAATNDVLSRLWAVNQEIWGDSHSSLASKRKTDLAEAA